MSAGSRSPDLMLTMSPGTSWSASKVMRLPSLNTLAGSSRRQQEQQAAACELCRSVLRRSVGRGAAAVCLG